MTKKSELAVIDFTKFNVAQLPELNGKKEEIKAIIDANPAVSVVDNASYELAKKSRTAIRTLRTSLEKEQKDVKKRIKEYVLDVVDTEYDNIVLGVKNQEIIRQEPIDAWEEKKEQERLEKARLEQERIDKIKNSIGEFRANHENFILSCVFESIEATKEVFEKSVADFDRTLLAEYEVLFEDAVSYLTNLLNSRINTLTEQENIRLEQIRLAEERKKQEEEAKKIAEAQRIEREKFEAEQKAIAEKQRIAQEKFQKEKAEFEAKQAEAKFQERKQYLQGKGLYELHFEKDKDFEQVKRELLELDDSKFELLVSSIELLKLSKETPTELTGIFPKSDEIATENYQEEDVDQKSIGLSTRHKANTPAVELKEETWESVYSKFAESWRNLDSETFKNWLKENYLVPTRKI